MTDGLADYLPQIPDERPGPGHNMPPLAELLAEESAALKARADELVASAGRAAVTDDDTAGRATTLAKMLAEHAKEIDRQREERKKPFLEAGRVVDRHFGALKDVCDAARRRVVEMIDAHRRKKEAEAAAERRRLEDEARKAREAAEAAERARREAEAAAAAADRARRSAEEEARAAQARLDAEIRARQERERAEALQRQAEQTAAAPIASGYGQKAFARKVMRYRVTDRGAALKHAMKINPGPIHAAVEEVIKGQIKAKVTTFPGVEFFEETATVIR